MANQIGASLPNMIYQQGQGTLGPMHQGYSVNQPVGMFDYGMNQGYYIDRENNRPVASTLHNLCPVPTLAQKPNDWTGHTNAQQIRVCSGIEYQRQNNWFWFKIFQFG